MKNNLPTNTTRRRRFIYTRLHVIAAFLVGCCLTTLLLNFLHDFSSLDGLDSSQSFHDNFAGPKKVLYSKQHSPSIADIPQEAAVSSAVRVVAKQKLASNHDNMIHSVAGLECKSHGGPNRPEDVQEMVYWEDIPKDNEWQSPFLKKNERQYMTFESDGGYVHESLPISLQLFRRNLFVVSNLFKLFPSSSLIFCIVAGKCGISNIFLSLFISERTDLWNIYLSLLIFLNFLLHFSCSFISLVHRNNIRMSMETVLTMALAMGRVLVLPPSQKMYLLGKGQATFNFADFFPLQELAEEHAGFDIITMEQFLEETMGKTKDTKSQKIVFPPDNKKTKWDGDSGFKSKLAPWLRSIAVDPNWNPNHCIATFPKNGDQQNIDMLQQSMSEILKEEGDFAGKMAFEHYINKPTPVDASTKDRLRELLAQRKKLCIYDKPLQEASIIHFHGKSKAETGGRLLVHFYAFLFFQDWHTDLWMKRFVRDHVRYIDDIQCAAARIVHAIRSSNNSDKTDKLHQFDTFHIRRGDFQYKKTRVSAEEIVAVAKDEIPVGNTVYIGTDERDKDFFKPLKDHGWNLFFLDDFKDILGDVNPNYYGMIDQLIASRGRTFFGCWFSTFSGYITRIRGYHSQTNNPIGMLPDHKTNTQAYSEGRLPNSYYYALEEFKTRMHDYGAVKQNFYSREYPTSWRQLDRDVMES
jgi:hypothetical protein